MQCKSCGAEWKTNARTAVIVRCPFCGAELEQEKENKVVFQSAKENSSNIFIIIYYK